MATPFTGLFRGGGAEIDSSIAVKKKRVRKAKAHNMSELFRVRSFRIIEISPRSSRVSTS